MANVFSRKNCLNGLLILCASSLQAGTIGGYDDVMPSNTNGLYIAGNLGLQNLFDNESHTLYPEQHQLSALGIIGGGFIGYDYSLGRNTAVAFEFFSDATGTNTSISHPPSTYSMNQRYDIGLRLLPEYSMSDSTVAHVFLGYVNGNFSIVDNGVYGTISTIFNSSGLQTGIGFTTAVTEHIMTRVDMIYNLYLSDSNKGVFLVPPARQTYNNQFNALIGQFALLYKW
jgi:hypothetical protein